MQITINAGDRLLITVPDESGAPDLRWFEVVECIAAPGVCSAIIQRVNHDNGASIGPKLAITFEESRDCTDEPLSEQMRGA